MDLFKFDPLVIPTLLNRGIAINGAVDIMWAERYREPGEFKIGGPLSSGLREALPLGTIISHTNTYEAMIVENHEVIEEQDTDPTIEITGRSLEVLFDDRVVGADEEWPTSGTDFMPFTPYVMLSDYVYEQALILLKDHVTVGHVLNTEDALANMVIEHDLSYTTGVNEQRVIKRGSLHAAMVSLLEVDNLGIRIVRQNSHGGPKNSPTDTKFQIHNGVDRSTTVIFSSDTGDFDSAGYLWSNKKLKNCALISGKIIETVVMDPTVFGPNRRWMHIDASDIDEELNEMPDDATALIYRNRMEARGRQLLQAQRLVDIARLDVSKDTPYQYRIDYDMGDIVAVNGTYGEVEKRRVTEYVEIEDEYGVTGHPTLSVDND